MNRIRFVLALLFGVVFFGSLPVSAADAAGASGASATTANLDAVKEEMGQLVEQAVQLAAEPLQKSDRFIPYGVLKTKDGKLRAIRWNEPKPPKDVEVFKRIFGILRSEARRPEVVAAVTVATTALPTSDGKSVRGIRAEVDHRDGAPLIVVVPFTHENGKLVLGTLIYRPGRNAVFDHPEAAGAPPPPAVAVPAAGSAAPAGKP